jgi:FkbM family methyltransferase
MLFSPKELKKFAHVDPTRILHVGAHQAEERKPYIEAWGLNLESIVWIEGQRELVAKLEKIVDERFEKVIEAIIWSEDGIEMDFYLASNSEASSLLTFDLHADQYPEISINATRKVKTTTLDVALKSEIDFDFINLDIQGAELPALLGMGDKLDSLRWIYSEINKRYLYTEVAQLWELEEFLSKKGFRLLAKRWTPSAGWGDAIFVKKEEFSYWNYMRLLVSSYQFYAKQMFHRARATARIRSRLGFKSLS